MKNLKLITGCILISFMFFQQATTQTLPTSVASGIDWITTGGKVAGCPCGTSSISVLGATGKGGCIKLQTGNTSAGPGGDIYVVLGSGPSGYGKFRLGTSTSSTPLSITSTGNIVTTGTISGSSITSSNFNSPSGSSLSSRSGTSGAILDIKLTGQGGTKTFASFDYANGITFDYNHSAIKFNDAGVTRMTIKNGNVGIGCTNPVVKLAVNGKIQATEVEIKTTPCSDYVFEQNYKLMSLKDLERFVTANKHLPEVPSAKEFKENGYRVGEMDNLLLQKIEELTLYIIEQDRQINELNDKITELQNK